MRAALITIGSLMAVGGVLWFWTQYERATLYKCTACFSDNPSRCATRRDTSDDYSPNEFSARTDAVSKLCMDDNGAKFDACTNLPPERFNIQCTSWRQWARKPATNPFVVH